MNDPRPAVNVPERLGHAVVLGGSITGLLCARVLADHFRRVTVLERGGYPFSPTPRPELAQARHLHVVLKQGVETLNRLFPTFGQDLVHGGALRFDYGRGAVVGVDDRFLAAYDSDLWIYGASRALLDWTLVQRVAEHPGVTLRSGHVAEDLQIDADNTVRGVVLEGGETLPADLVVDATGRASRVPRWLRAHGLSQVEEVVVDPRLTYACRLYTPPAGQQLPWNLLMSMPRPPRVPRSGGIFRIEGNRWQVTLAAMADDTLPGPDDTDGWLRFARTLPVAEIGEALAGATPVGPAAYSRATANQLRRYDTMKDFPGGLLCVGDAACALNPLYGQGITVAAMSVEAMADALGRARREGGDALTQFSRRFQRTLAQLVTPAATLAISADAAWPHTRGLEGLGVEGRFLRSRGGDWVRGYAERVLQVAIDRPDVARSYMEVMHLVRPSSAILTPSMMWRALRHRPHTDVRA